MYYSIAVWYWAMWYTT